MGVRSEQISAYADAGSYVPRQLDLKSKQNPRSDRDSAAGQLMTN